MRIVYVSLLICLSVFTSLTVVVDASEWYGALYHDLLFFTVQLPKLVRGVVFALLLEGFLALLMATRLPERPVVTGTMRVMALVVFIVIGYGTYQGILEGNRDKLSTNPQLAKSIKDTKEAIARNEAQQRILSCTDSKGDPVPDCNRQPTNYALALQEGNRLNKTLEEYQAKAEDSNPEGDLQRHFLLVAKFAMLAANAVSLWLIGLLVATGDVPSPHRGRSEAPQTEKPTPPVKQLRQRMVKWTKRDFQNAMKRQGLEPKDVLEQTGLNSPQLSNIVNHTHKVIGLLTGSNKDRSNGGE